MKKLYKICCSGKTALYINNLNDIFVIAESMQEAEKFVSEIKLIADEKESNKCLLVV